MSQSCEKHAALPVVGHSPCAGCEIERLKAENEELRKDAERYRWIRSDVSVGKSDFCIMRKHWGADSLSAVVCLDEADIQIDAAMSKDPLANPGQ
jgi:hypothetical protein